MSLTPYYPWYFHYVKLCFMKIFIFFHVCLFPMIFIYTINCFVTIYIHFSSFSFSPTIFLFICCLTVIPFHGQCSRPLAIWNHSLPYEIAIVISEKRSNEKKQTYASIYTSISLKFITFPQNLAIRKEFRALIDNTRM